MIKTSGYRVSPTEVEEVALRDADWWASAWPSASTHPTLGQAIAGDRHRAATAAPRSTLQALLAECRSRMPAYMVPAAHRVRDGPLPRNPNGKIDRKLLATAGRRGPRDAERPDAAAMSQARVDDRQHRPARRTCADDQFAVVDGELRGRRHAADAAGRARRPARRSTPTTAACCARASPQLRAALPAAVKLHYAMKANPMPALVGFMAGLVDGIDVASAGELKVALDAGADAARDQLRRARQARRGAAPGGGRAACWSTSSRCANWRCWPRRRGELGAAGAGGGARQSRTSS
ncbi:MAG: hypothetical protein MZW92_21475 [Comamonadaceae bacterium]|nr:hypothetical protein [Comamonadaceae bacterium]